jgi:hypothetical protein
MTKGSTRRVVPQRRFRARFALQAFEVYQWTTCRNWDTCCRNMHAANCLSAHWIATYYSGGGGHPFATRSRNA